MGKATVVVLLWIIPMATGFYLTNSTHILHYNKSSDESSVVFHQPHGRIVGLSADISRELLFWSDVSDQHRGVYSARTNSGKPLQYVNKLTYTDNADISGLSVDWLGHKVYLADRATKSIRVTDYTGDKQKDLIIDGVENPRGIYADPINGYLFWSDQAKRTIERTKLDGSERITLVDEDLFWPNQFTMYNNSLYWVDAWSQALMSCDIDGNNVRDIASLSSHTQLNPVFGLVIHNDVAYTAPWYMGYMIQVNLTLTPTATTNNIEDQAESPQLLSAVGHDLIAVDAVFSFVSVDQQTQSKELIPPCDYSECSDNAMCLPLIGEEYRCTCPDNSGLVLGDDRRTCQEPQEALLYVSSAGGYIAMADTSNPTDRSVIARSAKPVAVAYDYYNQNVYWSDVQQRTIFVKSLSDRTARVFLSQRDSIGIVENMVFDPIQGYLYFTNMNHMVIDGVTYGWHKIEAVSLAEHSGMTAHRRVIVANLQQPRAMWVDQNNRFLYYTTVGSDASLWRSKLDGSEQTRILNGLHHPVGLMAVQRNKLVITDTYVADSPSRSVSSSQPGNVVFYMSDESKETWSHFLLDNVNASTFASSTNGSSIYMTSWSSGSIAEYKITDSNDITYLHDIITGVVQPTGLLYTVHHEQQQGSSLDTCSTCVDMCFAVNDEGSDVTSDSNDDNDGSSDGICVCDSYMYVSNSTATPTVLPQCHAMMSAPTLLVSDMASLLLSHDPLSPESSPTNTHYTTLSYTHDRCIDNVVGLAYDRYRNVVYYSDVDNRGIYAADLNMLQSWIVSSDVGIVEYLLLDEDNRELYWSDYLMGTITVISVDVSPQDVMPTPRVIATGLTKPRGMALDSTNKSLYYTEWSSSGSGGHVSRLSLTTFAYPRNTVIKQGLVAPSDVVIHRQLQLYYVTDRTTVSIYDLQGNARGTLYSCQHYEQLYAIQLSADQSTVYTSVWSNHVARGYIVAIDTRTRVHTRIATHLTRPTQFYVQYDEDITGCPIDHGCSHGCAVVSGSPQCYCNYGDMLAYDGRRCIPGMSQSSARSSSSCTSDSSCGEHAQCMHTTGADAAAGTTCMCLPGYQPDSQQQCVGCQAGYYKASLGDVSCTQCPAGSTSTTRAAVACDCMDTSTVWDPLAATCSSTKSGTCPAHTACTSRDAQRCTDDTDCPAALKCCSTTLCEGGREGSDPDDMRCVDPLLQNYCSLQGNMYNVYNTYMVDGDDDGCTVCTCHNDNVLADLYPDMATQTCDAQSCAGTGTDACPSHQQLNDDESGCCGQCPDFLQSQTACVGGLELRHCPTGILHVNFTDTAYADVDPPITVIDTTGMRRRISVSRVPGYTRYWYDDLLLQTHPAVVPVTITASSWNPEGFTDDVTCHFTAQIADTAPPVLRCPSDSYLYSVYYDPVAAVWGPPSASDNVAVTTLASDYAYYTPQHTGTRNVTYTATDAASNVDTCTFSVHVIKQDAKCNAMPLIINGRMSCDTDTCYLYCNHGYNINPAQPISSSYTCKQQDWLPSVHPHITVLACVRISEPRWFGEAILTFTSLSSYTTIRDILASLQVVLNERYMRRYQQYGGTLDVSVYEYTNTDTPQAYSRLRREKQQQAKHRVRVYVSDRARENTENLLHDLSTDVLTGALMIRGNAEWIFADKKFDQHRMFYDCPLGAERVNSTTDGGLVCVACPVGMYYSVTSARCQLCPADTYQHQEAQTSCLSCASSTPDTTSSMKGMFIKDMCVRLPEESSVTQHSNSLSLTIVVIIICACIVALLLIVGIVTVYVVRRQHNKRKPASLSGADTGHLQYTNEIYMDSDDIPNLESIGEASAAQPDVVNDAEASSYPTKLQLMIEEQADQQPDATTPYSSVRFKTDQ